MTLSVVMILVVVPFQEEDKPQLGRALHWGSGSDVHCVHCALCTVDCALCTLNCELCTVHSELCTVDSELYTVDCQLCTVNCKPCTVDCVNCVFCTVHWCKL